MKRPATFVIVASLLVSASALAAGNPYAARERTQKIESHTSRNDRGHDNRGNDNRSHETRGNDNRGRDARNNHQRNDDQRGHERHAPPVIVHRDNDRHDNDRHDWNNRRDWNDHRNDNRNDNNRRDWNDHRNDNRHGNDRPDRDRHNYNGNGNNNRWDRYRSDWDRHPHYNDNRRYDRRDYARYRFSFGSYHPPRGYYYRAWHRGDRLPSSYYGRSYIVYDWRPYRLYEPPYGYNWVRVGNDVVLTAVATGIVLDVLYDIWY